MKKPAIMIAVESPFGEYDAERYRLADFDHLAHLNILDLTPLIKPDYWAQFGDRAIQHNSIRLVSSDAELRIIIESSHWDAWIDELGTSRTARNLRRKLQSGGVLRVWLRLGLLPGDFLIKTSLRHRLLARRSQLGWGRALRGMTLTLPRRIFRSTPTPDVVLGSGSFTAREVASNRPIIWAHSFDFEKASRASQVPQSSARQRIVFLDQALGRHPDQLHSRLRAPVNRDPYLHAMRYLFSRLESATGGSVEIALHPKSNAQTSSDAFGGRFSSQEGAHTLVSGAHLVLCHASASVSFAVIWRRPVLFVTSTELRNSWYHTHITQMASELERPIINVDELDAIPDQQISNLAQLDVNDEAYARYEEHYIRSRWSPPLPLWECFVMGINEVLSRTVAP